MTNAEMQKAMGFIVNHQAQASSKIDALAEAQKAAEARWTQTEEGVRALLSTAQIHEREFETFSEKLDEVGERIAKVNDNGPRPMNDSTR